MKSLIELGTEAHKGAAALALMEPEEKNALLKRMAQRLRDCADEILEANRRDLAAARENGIKEAMIDRLSLSRERIDAIADGVLQVADLHDPVGEVVREFERPNGMKIQKVRVPIGVLGIIFESRPNVTVDAAALTLKSGNAVILRGGKEAIFSNMALTSVMQSTEGMPVGAVALVEDTSRETAREMMRLDRYIDVLIPRGGAGLIRSVVENATVPVIETGSGICHGYIEKDADLAMAVSLAVNAKTSRPSVCNAMETLLVDEAVAGRFLPMLKEAMPQVELRGCERTQQIIDVLSATEEDWATEYNDYILSIRVVEGIDEAIEHITRYGTRHSEMIVTENAAQAERFRKEVDAAAVYHNVSTRFTDGFEFGFGAEIGISTQKLHARGPMGLEELTTVKYVISGDGQIR